MRELIKHINEGHRIKARKELMNARVKLWEKLAWERTKEIVKEIREFNEIVFGKEKK